MALEDFYREWAVNSKLSFDLLPSVYDFKTAITGGMSEYRWA